MNNRIVLGILCIISIIISVITGILIMTNIIWSITGVIETVILWKFLLLVLAFSFFVANSVHLVNYLDATKK